MTTTTTPTPRAVVTTTIVVGNNTSPTTPVIPVYDNATRSRLIAAERERINDRRQHARGTGKLDVPPDIADGEVDFAVTSSLSGRRALSALARHSVQDVRDERCVRACALGCSDQCNHGMRAFDAVAAARAQRDVDISTLSTRVACDCAQPECALRRRD